MKKTKFDGEIGSGQDPLSKQIIIWISLLVLLWAGNSVVVKLVIRDVPSFWAAFFRFAVAFPFVWLFVRWKLDSLSVSVKSFFKIAVLAVGTVIQISSFNYGSQFTSGGRITLFIFTYTIVIPLVAPFFIKGESLNKKTIIGSLVAFTGILIAVRGSLSADLSSTIKGDLIEFFSSMVLAANIIYNKYLTRQLSKWRIVFWQFFIATILFAIFGFVFETFNPAEVKMDAWLSLAYQAIVVSVFCFLSYSYILSKHNSAQVSVFFTATPLLGMLLGVVLLGETFELGLLFAGVFVGIGIFISSRKG